jgi:flagellar assembly factor FliW
VKGVDAVLPGVWLVPVPRPVPAQDPLVATPVAPAAGAAPVSASVDAVDEAVDTNGEPDLPVLTLVRPLPGFPDQTQYVLVAMDGDDADDEPDDSVNDADEAEDGAVLYELRSIEEPALRFLVAVPGAFFSDYDVVIDDDTCADLGLTDAGDALVLVMVTLGSEPTANLLAPVVINSRTRQAVQVILSGTDWPVRAPMA